MSSAKFSKVSSLVILGVRDFQWTAELQEALKSFPVGGIALFNSPFDSPLNIWKDRQASLEIIYDFMKKTEHLPFLSVDQEGGRVRRLRGAFINLPPAHVMGEAYRQAKITLDEIEKLYAYAGQQLAFSRVHLNFAPVCDLLYQESSKVIGDRSFGASLAEVRPILEASLRGYRKAGVHTTLKHLPGHGPTQMDSHEQVAVVFKSKADLLRSDLEVFKVCAPFASAVMTAHIAFQEEPTRILSLDAEFIEEMRDQLPAHLGWITDDLLSMKAVSELRPWRAAFEAGYDFLLLCGELDAGVNAIEDLIRYVEKKDLGFAEEEELDERIERSGEIFRTVPVEIPSFHEWSRAIENYEAAASRILEKIL